MTLKVVLVGDINLKQDLRMAAETALELVADELAAADLRLGNLEGCFSDPSVELAYKPFWRHVEPEMSAALKDRFDILACANNVHYGEAINDSIAVLDGLGIQHCGAGANRAAARAPAITEVAGRTVGVVAFTSVYWPVGAKATDTAPGVATIRAYTAYEPHARINDMPGGPATVRSYPDAADLEAACADIRRLRTEVDIVIAYFHWGVVRSAEIAEYQHLIGRAVIEAGADLVVGSSPHMPQGVERVGRGAILHSLGNFIFGAEYHRDHSRTGLLARAEFDDSGLCRLELVPVARNDADQMELLDPLRGEGASIAEFVVAKSIENDTPATITPTGISIDLGEAGKDNREQ
jgi:poly-gamma-glutamate synthesis protein (capsule biosynthesis protein)